MQRTDRCTHNRTYRVIVRCVVDGANNGFLRARSMQGQQVQDTGHCLQQVRSRAPRRTCIERGELSRLCVSEPFLNELPDRARITGKGAGPGLTSRLAFEAARFGVRVNAVSPGFIETGMTAALTPEMRAGLGIPLGRLGTPEEVAEAVAFLLSRRATYLTGEVLHVDGGLFGGK